MHFWGFPYHSLFSAQQKAAKLLPAAILFTLYKLPKTSLAVNSLLPACISYLPTIAITASSHPSLIKFSANASCDRVSIRPFGRKKWSRLSSATIFVSPYTFCFLHYNIFLANASERFSNFFKKSVMFHSTGIRCIFLFVGWSQVIHLHCHLVPCHVIDIVHSQYRPHLALSLVFRSSR